MNVHTKYIHFIICDTGGNFGRHQNASFCYQKVATRSRSASVHSDFSYDALRAHRRGRGDKPKNDIFFACHHEAYSALRTI